MRTCSSCANKRIGKSKFYYCIKIGIMNPSGIISHKRIKLKDEECYFYKEEEKQ